MSGDFKIQLFDSISLRMKRVLKINNKKTPTDCFLVIIMLVASNYVNVLKN